MIIFHVTAAHQILVVDGYIGNQSNKLQQNFTFTSINYMSFTTSTASSMDIRCTSQGGVFDTMLTAKLGYNSSSLALIDYGVQFTKARAFKDSNHFVGANGREFTTNFFGEISLDFTAHPTGNYTSPGDGAYVPISDSTRVKFAISLQVPTHAPHKMHAMFTNQLATLGNIISYDSDSAKQTRVKSWIKPSDNDTSLDRFVFTTVANNKHINQFKTKVDINDDANPGPSHPILVQLNVRDPQGRLIHPQNTYQWLAPGALVVVHATMHIFQLSATSIQVIDKSDVAIPVPSVLGLPMKVEKVETAEQGDKTTTGSFIDFTSMLAASGNTTVHNPQMKGKCENESDQDETITDGQELPNVYDEDVDMDLQDWKGECSAGSNKKTKKGEVVVAHDLMLSMCDTLFGEA
ncbi:hypothetical protein FB446DRAFT_794869 [Lentinula raphanica]|nr:hypothetical protein FB446DRAFT_794869 [Lentinula raphanica]